MKSKKYVKIIICAMAAALAIAFAGCAVSPANTSSTAPAQAGPVQPANRITVNATGTVKVMPDVAYVTVGVKTQDAEMKKAQQQNKDLMNQMIAAVKAQGLTDDDIRTTNYSAYPMYDYSDGKDSITGYEVTNMVELTVKDIEGVGEIIDAASGSGANTAYPINFALLDETDFYNEALEDALDKAQGKADTIAAAGGYKILRTLEIAEGGMGYVPTRNDYVVMEEAVEYDGGVTPISAGELEVTATITVIYEID